MAHNEHGNSNSHTPATINELPSYLLANPAVQKLVEEVQTLRTELSELTQSAKASHEMNGTPNDTQIRSIVTATVLEAILPLEKIVKTMTVQITRMEEKLLERINTLIDLQIHPTNTLRNNEPSLLSPKTSNKRLATNTGDPELMTSALLLSLGSSGTNAVWGEQDSKSKSEDASQSDIAPKRVELLNHSQIAILDGEKRIIRGPFLDSYHFNLDGRTRTAKRKRQMELRNQGVATENDDDRRKRRGHLPQSATSILREWLFLHQDRPYPTEEEKKIMMGTTGLTIVQINNWFSNARRRILRKAFVNEGFDANEDYDEEETDDDKDEDFQSGVATKRLH